MGEAITRTAAATLATAPYFNEEQIAIIRDTICKNATPAEMWLFIRTCERLRLDPFAKQIYAVKRWDSQLRAEVLQSQVAIDGFRLVAERTGEYEGQLPQQWCGADGVWRDVWLASEPPAAARVGVLRRGHREPMWGVARYASYVQTKKEGGPNSTWAKMPDVMLAKCAEALALRKAFPNELSGVYAPEEMGQADNDVPRAAHVIDMTPAMSGSTQVRLLGAALHEAPEAEGASAPSDPLLRQIQEAERRLSECISAAEVESWVQTWGATVRKEPDSVQKRERWERFYATAEERGVKKTAFRALFQPKKQPKPAASIEDDRRLALEHAMGELASVETPDGMHAWAQDNRAALAALEVGSTVEHEVWSDIKARCESVGIDSAEIESLIG